MEKKERNTKRTYETDKFYKIIYTSVGNVVMKAAFSLINYFDSILIDCFEISDEGYFSRLTVKLCRLPLYRLIYSDVVFSTIALEIQKSEKNRACYYKVAPRNIKSLHLFFIDSTQQSEVAYWRFKKQKNPPFPLVTAKNAYLVPGGLTFFLNAHNSTMDSTFFDLLPFEITLQILEFIPLSEWDFLFQTLPVFHLAWTLKSGKITTFLIEKLVCIIKWK
jgi:hypothetical protein